MLKLDRPVIQVALDFQTLDESLKVVERKGDFYYQDKENYDLYLVHSYQLDQYTFVEFEKNGNHYRVKRGRSNDGSSLLELKINIHNV